MRQTACTVREHDNTIIRSTSHDKPCCETYGLLRVRSALKHYHTGGRIGGRGHRAVWLHRNITGLPITAGQRATLQCVLHTQIAGRTSNERRASLRKFDCCCCCSLPAEQTWRTWVLGSCCGSILILSNCTEVYVRYYVVDIC